MLIPFGSTSISRLQLTFLSLAISFNMWSRFAACDSFMPCCKILSDLESNRAAQFHLPDMYRFRFKVAI